MQRTTINPFPLNSAQLRNKKWIHPTVLMLLAGLLFGATAGIGKGQRPNGSAPPDELKVMTWNIRGGEYKRRGKNINCTLNRTPGYVDNITQEINRHEGLDVIALQEIYRSQATELAENLGRTQGFHPRPYFVETKSCASGPADNDFGIAIISRYPFVDVEKRRLSTPFCDLPEQRMVARVIIDVAGVQVHIYNTHLTACGAAFVQAAEAFQIRDLVNDDRRVPRSFAFRPVLMGDFNAVPRSLAYQAIRPGLFLDAWREDNGEDPGITFETFRPHARIDYIFVGRGGVFHVEDVQVTSSQTLFDEFGLDNPTEFTDFNKVPDHRPVVGRLLFTFLNA